MELEKLKIGLAVSFHKLVKGKCVGFEKEVYKITEINLKDWQPCNCRLSNGIFTNNLAIEPVEAKQVTYMQLSLFDLMEV